MMTKINSSRFPYGRERWSAYVELQPGKTELWMPWGMWLLTRLGVAPGRRIHAADVVREFEASWLGRTDRRAAMPERFVRRGPGAGWDWLAWVIETRALPVRITWTEEA